MDQYDPETEMELQLRRALADAAQTIGSESPESASAMLAFARGTHVRWTDTAEDCARDFMTGYELGTNWLRTGPPRDEVEEIDELYRLTQPDAPDNSGTTVYADASKLPNFIGFVAKAGLDPELFEVCDGATLKAEMVADYGTHLQTTFNPPARTLLWPSLHRLFEGVGLSCHHEVEA